MNLSEVRSRSVNNSPHKLTFSRKAAEVMGESVRSPANRSFKVSKNSTIRWGTSFLGRSMPKVQVMKEKGQSVLNNILGEKTPLKKKSRRKSRSRSPMFGNRHSRLVSSTNKQFYKPRNELFETICRKYKYTIGGDIQVHQDIKATVGHALFAIGKKKQGNHFKLFRPIGTFSELLAFRAIENCEGDIGRSSDTLIMRINSLVELIPERTVYISS